MLSIRKYLENLLLEPFYHIIVNKFFFMSYLKKMYISEKALKWIYISPSKIKQNLDMSFIEIEYIAQATQ